MPLDNAVAGANLEADMKRGFTLIELLLVIGIVLILIGILLPTVTQVRKAAQDASTQARMSGISAGVLAYFTDFQSYPGPLHGDQVMRQGVATVPPTLIEPAAIGSNVEGITGTENLVLGLSGGLKRNGAVTGDQFVFDPALVTNGPGSLNPAALKRYQAYYADTSAIMGAGTAPYSYEGIVAAGDTNIPEYVDNFPDAMPLLYYRAKRGNAGIIGRVSTGTNLQYRLDDNLPYVQRNGAASIGPVALKMHGLRKLGIAADPSDGNNVTGAKDATEYFTNPNVAGTPRYRDGWILISAGKDRVYGTGDDIIFGN